MELLVVRRHPVKAMAGETLDVVDVGPRGLAGDRWYAVRDAQGRFASGKNTRRFRLHDEVFEFGARTVGPDGDVEVYRHDGSAGPWVAGDRDLDEHLSQRFDEPVRVQVEGEVSHFDDAPVSLVGTASLDRVAELTGAPVDHRRLRTNLVVSTTEPFVEEDWTSVRIGTVTFRVVQRTTRCRMVDLAQNGLTDQVPLLKALGSTRDTQLGVYLAPQDAGTLRVGDPVTPTR